MGELAIFSKKNYQLISLTYIKIGKLLTSSIVQQNSTSLKLTAKTEMLKYLFAFLLKI
jgi:hypothetical protein